MLVFDQNRPSYKHLVPEMTELHVQDGIIDDSWCICPIKACQWPLLAGLRSRIIMEFMLFLTSLATPGSQDLGI